MGALLHWPQAPDRRAVAYLPANPAGLDVEAYSSLGGAIRDVLDVLQVARSIEPDPDAVMLWYFHVRIQELGAFTAEQLVRDGHAGEVIRFLRSIQSGDRH